MEATKHPIPKSALLQSIASSYNSEIHRCGASEQWRMQHSAVQCSAADRSIAASNITRDELVSAIHTSRVHNTSRWGTQTRALYRQNAMQSLLGVVE